MLPPLVSVIIPTYNYAHYIREAIDSVLQQSYPSSQIEIIVLDDGSTDDTQTILKEYIDSGKIKYFYQDNKGKANATSEAILKSAGTYIFNLDADDYYFPGKIEMSVRVFETDSSIVHVASPAKTVYQNTQRTENEQLPEEIIEKTLDGNELLRLFYTRHILFGGGSTYAARASVLQAILVPDGVDMYIDEFLIMAILPFGKSYFFREPLSVWRAHTSNYSGSNNTKEKAVIKGERLLRSSAAILNYLREQPFDKTIVQIYEVSDATRRIAHKEANGTKSIRDILSYGAAIFFHIRPSWQVIQSYHVLNRLIPLSLFHFLKNRKQTSKK